MTTIAYRNGVIAADTLATWGDSRDGYAVKIRKRGPIFAAGAGALGPAQEFLDWFVGGMKGHPPDPEPDQGSYGFLILPDDQYLNWGSHGWERTRNEFFAVGTGSEFAKGAMSMGATAEEAVRVAIQWDTNSGGDITVLRR